MQVTCQILVMVDHKYDILFIYDGITILWRFVQQTMVTTSSYHAELLALHKASGEYIWLRSLIQHIQ